MIWLWAVVIAGCAPLGRDAAEKLHTQPPQSAGEMSRDRPAVLSTDQKVTLIAEGPQIRVEGVSPGGTNVAYRVLSAEYRPYDSSAVHWYEIETEIHCVSNNTIREPLPNEGGRLLRFIDDRHVIARTSNGELMSMSVCGPEISETSEVLYAGCFDGVVVLPSPDGTRRAETHVISRDESGIMVLSTELHAAAAVNDDAADEGTPALQWRVDEREGGHCALASDGPMRSFGWLSESLFLVGDRIDGPPVLLEAKAGGRQRNVLEMFDKSDLSSNASSIEPPPWTIWGIDIGSSNDFAMLAAHRNSEGVQDELLLWRQDDVIDLEVNSGLRAAPDGQWLAVTPAEAIEARRSSDTSVRILPTIGAGRCGEGTTNTEALEVLWSETGVSFGLRSEDRVEIYEFDQDGCVTLRDGFELPDGVKQITIIDENNALVVRQVETAQILELVSND